MTYVSGESAKNLVLQTLSSSWSVENLYPTPIYCAEVSDFDRIQNQIKGVIDRTKFEYCKGFGDTHKLSPHFAASNRQYLMDQIPAFTQELRMHISRYCRELNYSNTQYQFTSSWMTLFEKGDYAHIHNHNGVDFSGVYYYNKEEYAEDFFFESPVEGAKLSSAYYGGRIYPHTKTGSLIIFPGWLYHGVDKIESNIKRCSISFNVEFNKFVDNYPINIINYKTVNV
mgnify:FL=1|tara:strand:- start:1122 stop:1802 length:681 start_codon:yes stop_codon:yes gene_type:complete